MDLLANTVRPYAWGSTTAIPELLGTEPTGEPQAELWMGAHPVAPSRIDRGGGPIALSEVIAADPEGELGAATVEAFGPRLPFLFKLLAADSPLSLQVHPDLARAKEGFADEEERGVPLDAPHRSYKDANHKPELVCALTPFSALCGFRPPERTAELLEALEADALKPYVDILRARPEDEALREVLTAVLSADREAMAEAVETAAEAARRLGAGGGPYAPAYAAYAGIARHHPGDPGVIAAMLLNFVHLRPGEALYLSAGIPHAHLGGLGAELMASSDNVLRCGLTPKHVDVPELLRVVRFEAMEPEVLRPEAAPDGEEVYRTPAEEFRLSRHILTAENEPRVLDDRTPQILLCTDGEITLRRAGPDTDADPDDGTGVVLGRGRSAFVRAGERVAVSGGGTLFRATAAVQSG
ncbi:MAG TPA: mannose-6-phosphate isomerase, class I [Streptomyces sp.]|nr:mannose-6-phosphate isomerase, class I [Streptomyces sp.]